MSEFNFKKYFGQNFLINFKRVIELVDLLNIKEGDQILEIGPGEGALTEEILNRGAEVIAVEIDEELIPVLEDRFYAKNLKVMSGDILKKDIKTLGLKKRFKLISALPYNISKLIINKFLKEESAPSLMVLIMQKEVAEDYCRQGKFLNILAQTYSREVTYIDSIPKEEFNPIPKVAGGIVVFKGIGAQIENPETFLRFVKIGFSSPRKILSRNLANGGYDKKDIEEKLQAIDYSPLTRAGELDFRSWLQLYKSCN